MVRDTRYIIRRVIIGVLIALILGFLNTRKVQALDTVGFDQWNMVYRNQTVGQTWDNTFIYRLGEQQSLLAINVYFPYFEGYYNGTITIQGDPVQFPNGSLQLTNQFFKLFLYENGSYSSDYFIGTCDGNLTCTFNFRGTSKQLQSNRFSLQLLINNDPFTTTYIFYPAFRVSSSVYVSNDSNSGNNDIINNQNENTQNIINNQNENTQKEIESQKVCEYIDKSSVFIDGYYLSSTGTEIASPGNGITDYIRINSETVIKELKHNPSNITHYCFYNINKTKIACYSNNSMTSTVSIPDNSSYVRFSLSTSYDQPILNICKTGNQALNDSINDDSAPDSDSFISDLQNLTPSSTPITDLLTMPLTLMNAMLTGINGTCSTYNLGTLYGVQLSLPCIDLEELLGSGLWTILDGLCAFFMIMGIGRLCIRIYENITSLNDPLNMIYGGGR